MKKFFAKFNIAIILLTIIFLGFASSVFAEEQNVIDIKYWDQNASTYKDLEGQSLFEENSFLPGDVAVGKIKIINKISSPVLIQIFGNATSESSGDYNLADVLKFKISNLNKNEDYYGENSSKTLQDFFNDSNDGIDLSMLAGEEDIEYLLIATLNDEVDNDYQGLKAEFDFEIGFLGEIISDEGDTTNQNGTSGGGSRTLTHETHIKIINVGHSILDDNNFDRKIFWDTINEENNDLETYGAVVYGESSIDNDNLGYYPNYGYDHRINDENINKVVSHNVMITNLNPNTIYYYRVLAWASPEIYSEEHSFITALISEEEFDEFEQGLPKTGEEGDFEEEETDEQDIREETASEEEESSAIVAEDTSVSTSPEESSEEKEEETTTDEEEKEEEKDTSLLASLKSLLGDFGTVCFDCFPWWVLLILALYPLYRCCFTKKEDKKEFISWFAWTALHLIVAAILYLSGYLCLPLWVFIISALGTLLFWHTYAQDKKRAQKITLVGLILILIFLILLLILECLYAWLILFLILIFFSYLLAIGRGDSREARQMSLPSN
jgi:hypothetical protein